MDIKNGLVPKWVADRLNGPTNDAPVDGVRDGITEPGPSDNDGGRAAEVLLPQTASAEIDVPSSPAARDHTMQTSSSPEGRPQSIGSNPWTCLFPTRPITAAIYVPVSTPDEDQNEQMSELRSYAFRQGWDVLEFRERRGRAGTRPVFNQMTRRFRTPKFRVVLVESLDCFARSLADLCENVTWLHGLGIRFIAVNEGIDLNPKTGAGESFFRYLTMLAKVESDMIVRNVRAGVARAKSLGVHCGRPRRRFARAQANKLRQEGLSIGAIAARLGVPASTVADELKAPKPGSGSPTETSAFSERRILG